MKQSFYEYEYDFANFGGFKIAYIYDVSNSAGKNSFFMDYEDPISLTEDVSAGSNVVINEKSFQAPPYLFTKTTFNDADFQTEIS